MIGIKYSDASIQLNGCYNDVDNYKQVLIKNFGYKNKNITVLFDKTNYIYPTKNNIIKYINKLITRSHEENINEITIFYSGHGTSIDTLNDLYEKDNQNECIVPVDYNTSGYILDNEMNKLLSKFNIKTKIICIFDCCNSGTCADLPTCFSYEDNEIIEDTFNGKIMNNKNIFVLSGCKDNEESFDTNKGGLFTRSLIDTLHDNNYNCTIGSLLIGINNKLDKYLRNYNKKLLQNPVLSVSLSNCNENTIVFSKNNTFNKVTKYLPTIYQNNVINPSIIKYNNTFDIIYKIKKIEKSIKMLTSKIQNIMNIYI